jgi:YjbE family integral membrane protein
MEIAVSDLSALLQVILVDLVLAGDNAIVVGMAAAGLPREQRKKVIAIGIAAATVLRIMFALVTVQLLQIVGLVLAGGLLLLWVSWKLWRELEAQRAGAMKPAEIEAEAHRPPEKSFKDAVMQIIVADVSMSLDNVLAVAGIARESIWVLIVGLVLSVAFMGMCATLIARLLEKQHWIAYVGLIVIFYVSLKMIADGILQIVVLTQ